MNIVNTAIYSSLNNSTALTSLLAGTTSIYYLQAPEAAAYPYIVFSQMAGGDVNDNPNRTRDILYYVRAYGTVSAAQCGSIISQVDNLWHGGSLSVTDYNNFWLMHEDDIDLVETLPTGGYVYSIGATYRVKIDKQGV